MSSIKTKTFSELTFLNLSAWVDSPSSAEKLGQSKQPADTAARH